MSSSRVVYTPQPELVLNTVLSPRYWLDLWQHRRLIRGLTSRRVQERFRGSVLGAIWAVLLPVLMLSVYAFAFVIVLGNPAESAATKLERTFSIFCGLIVYGVFSETANRSAVCIVSQPQFVKRVVFPLDAMPVIVFLECFVLALASVGVLLLGTAGMLGTVSASWLLLPFALIPLALFSLGVGWLLASIGVFVRDLSQLLGVLLQMLFFLMPICYPLESTPKWAQAWMLLNPLVAVIEQVRSIVLHGTAPAFGAWCLLVMVGLVTAQLGHAVFALTRRRFADVL